MFRENIKQCIASEFNKKRILVIGDLMVDEYITGKVTRISPEAPVPVLAFSEKILRSGGASNVAANVRDLGGSVMICGTVGDDDAGRWLIEEIEKTGSKGLVVREKDRPTTVKTRFATKGQQLLRMDRETAEPVKNDTCVKVLTFIKENKGSIDAVILSDYCKGMLLDAGFVSEIIKLCNESGILISIDSKSKNIAAFKGADFVKPNNLELEAAVGITISDAESLKEAGLAYLKTCGAKSLIVTRGGDGIALFKASGEQRNFAAAQAQVYDVTGAGDAVIATITLALISGMSIEEAIMLANIAAGIVISKVGTATALQSELLEKIDERKNS